MSIILAILIAFLPACPTEDSTGCYWDASIRGNGEGHSFIALDNMVILL